MSQSTQISTFNFESNSIRTLAINNEPWFVAKDVCDAIGLTNSRMSLLALDEDEKGVSLIYTPSGQQEMNIVSESGMYTLILRCRDAVKKGSIPHRFRKWVTAEVLPQIRKTGKYERKTTTDERTGLRQAVSALVSKKGLIYSEAYNLVHQYMNVESIEDIPADKLQSAVEYVHKIALEGELIIDVPLPQEKPEIAPISNMEIHEFINYWFATTRFHESVYFLMRKLASFRSRELDSVNFNYDVCQKYLRMTQPIVDRLIKQRNNPR
ncbi:Bro-N domain-containing protein [Rodentibacter pneumotropicus]|uniref:BRO-N domain-containing protein n=1 Tax=Rodentibacter pneumotropicus TaxID=758 RepID=UPI00109D4FCE|nr:Bro-N domain-containing protein [Rodentibacter pneumotropicus]THA16158.1 phage repressor protein/antirepressor Ant [Rodentibacter pneumotropicus]